VIGIVFVALDNRPRSVPEPGDQERPFIEKSMMIRQGDIGGN
jgi:hypothetical protein